MQKGEEKTKFSLKSKAGAYIKVLIDFKSSVPQQSFEPGAHLILILGAMAIVMPSFDPAVTRDRLSLESQLQRSNRDIP